MTGFILRVEGDRGIIQYISRETGGAAGGIQQKIGFKGGMYRFEGRF